MKTINQKDKNLAISKLNTIIKMKDWQKNYSFFLDPKNNKIDIFVEYKKNKFTYLFFDLHNKSIGGFDEIYFDDIQHYYDVFVLPEELYLNDLIYNIENYTDYYLSSNKNLLDFEFYYKDGHSQYFNNDKYLKALNEKTEFESENYRTYNFFDISSMTKSHPRYIIYKLLSTHFKTNELSYKYGLQSFLLNPVNESNILDTFVMIAHNFSKLDKNKSNIFWELIRRKIKEIFDREDISLEDVALMQNDFFAIDYFGNENPKELFNIYMQTKF